MGQLAVREARQGAPSRKMCGMTSNHSCSHSAFDRSSEISYLPDFMGSKCRNGPPKSRAPVGNVDHARVAGSRYFLGKKYGSVFGLSVNSRLKNVNLFSQSEFIVSTWPF